jgi:hypothetical protein
MGAAVTDDDRKMVRVAAFVDDFFHGGAKVIWSSQCSTPMTFDEFWAWSTQKCQACGTVMIDGVCRAECCK